MHLAIIIAQLIQEQTALYTYGPLGIICAFFMWRDVARDKEREKDREVSTALVHRIDGLTRQLMAEMVERGTVSDNTITYLRQQIAKIDSRLPQH